jgi:hypothetical protein
MEIKRTTQIVVETERRYVVRQQAHTEPVICSSCNEVMLSAEQAAVVFDLSTRTVYQLVEKGTTHFVETETGALFVCLRSLAEGCSATERITGEVL